MKTSRNITASIVFITMMTVASCTSDQVGNETGTDPECEVPVRNACVEYVGMCPEIGDPLEAADRGLTSFYDDTNFEVGAEENTDLEWLTRCPDGLGWGLIRQSRELTREPEMIVFNPDMTSIIGYRYAPGPPDPDSECRLGFWRGTAASFQCGHTLLVQYGSRRLECFEDDEGFPCNCLRDEFGDSLAGVCE